MKRVLILIIIVSLFFFCFACDKKNSDVNENMIDINQLNVDDEKNLDKRNEDLSEVEVEDQEKGTPTEDQTENNVDNQTEEPADTPMVTETVDPTEDPIEEIPPLTLKDLKTIPGEFLYADSQVNQNLHCYANEFHSSNLYGYNIGLKPSEYTMDIYTTKGKFYAADYPTEFNDIKSEKTFWIAWYHNEKIYDIEENPEEFCEKYKDTYIVIAYKKDNVYYGYLIFKVYFKICDVNENFTDRVVNGTFVEILINEVANEKFDIEESDLSRISKELFDEKIKKVILNYFITNKLSE